MALELYRARDCVEYTGRDPRIPVLRVGLTEPIREEKISLIAPVDTGFAGYVLVARDTYEKLGTAELPRSLFGVYQTMAGPVVLRRSKIRLEVGGSENESYIESPLYGVGKLLIGRSVLSKLDLAFLGSVQRTCFITAEK